jgi:uncharacterized protein with HEPN domain
MRDARLYLAEILAAADAVQGFVKGMEFDAFVQDDRTSSAVVRKFEIIGEASKNVPNAVKERHPEIPWKEMAGMRDRLIHSYFGVKYDLVWETIKVVIPKIRPMIAEVQVELEKERLGRK